MELFREWRRGRNNNIYEGKVFRLLFKIIHAITILLHFQASWFFNKDFSFNVKLFNFHS